jgi:molybdopterin converting factor small subunit
MSITVELTYDMSKALGTRSFDVATASNVAEVVRATREKFGAKGEEFEKLSRVAAIAVNGVLVNHREGMKTKLADGDTVAFLKAAAGG